MTERPWFKYYDPGVEVSPVYSHLPLSRQFSLLVERQPDSPFIYCNDEIFSYAEINLAATRLANAMIAAGLEKGECVAIALPNMTEFVVIALACFKAGAIAVLTNPRYTAHELAGVYRDCCAKAVFCQADVLEKMCGLVQGKETCLSHVVLVTPGDAEAAILDNRKICSFNIFLAQGDVADPQIDIALDDIALLIYTGGTTGVSKGCCITHRNLVTVASGWKQMTGYFTDIDHYKVLSSTPMYHIHGFQTAINANILLGGSMIILPEISIEHILNAINRFEPNVWPAVPAQIVGILNHPGFAASKVANIQHVGCGSAPIPLAKMIQFEKITGVPIIEGYGATETTMAVTSNPSRFRKPGSVGIPYPNIDCKVVDIATGDNLLKQGEVGELCFKGPQIIRQYWHNNYETFITFRAGWWYSGDVGYQDEDGYVYIVDRKKDMIICSGFKVFCSEVDQVLNGHPKIREAGVVGIPDPVRGETVKAYVVLIPGESLTDLEIKAYCRQFLAAYKVPTHYEFVNALPRTSIEKLDRAYLRRKQAGSHGVGENAIEPVRVGRGFCQNFAQGCPDYEYR